MWSRKTTYLVLGLCLLALTAGGIALAQVSSSGPAPSQNVPAAPPTDAAAAATEALSVSAVAPAATNDGPAAELPVASEPSAAPEKAPAAKPAAAVQATLEFVPPTSPAPATDPSPHRPLNVTVQAHAGPGDRNAGLPQTGRMTLVAPTLSVIQADPRTRPPMGGGGGGVMMGSGYGVGGPYPSPQWGTLTLTASPYGAPGGQESDPEMLKLVQSDAQMEQETAVLADQYRQAQEPGKKAELKTKLAELAKQHFDVRQQRREMELKKLEAQLERVRELVKRRTESREMIIKRHLSQLLGEEDDLAF